MKELERCMMSTSYFLEDIAIQHFAKTGQSVKGFVVTQAMRKELAEDDECVFFHEHEMLIGADCWEIYTSDYPAVMIINELGQMEIVK